MAGIADDPLHAIKVNDVTVVRRHGLVLYCHLRPTQASVVRKVGEVVPFRPMLSAARRKAAGRGVGEPSSLRAAMTTPRGVILSEEMPSEMKDVVGGLSTNRERADCKSPFSNLPDVDRRRGRGL